MHRATGEDVEAGGQVEGGVKEDQEEAAERGG